MPARVFPGDPELMEFVHEVVIPGSVAPELMDVPGVGTVSIGLRLAPAVSVAPRGTLPPTRLVPEPPTSTAVLALPVELETQPDVEVMPPPSKVEPEDVPLIPLGELELQLVLGMGLRPPGLSSVEARGTVVLMLLLLLEPRLPSGDVAPRPGDATAVCALAACEQRITSAANVNRGRIKIS